MEKLKAWTGLYIMIVEVGKAYKPTLGKVGYFPSVFLLWTTVVPTSVFFLFLSALWEGKKQTYL